MNFGEKRKKVGAIVVALDLTNEVFELAMRKKADLIVLHHPFIFEDEKTDINNGLLLCPNHDRLFENREWSIDKNFRVVLSNNIKELGIMKDIKLRVSYINEKTAKYLKIHFKQFSEKNHE